MKKLCKHGVSLFSTIILMILLLFAIAPLPIWAEDIPPVRVGFFSFDGYHMMDTNSNLSGYGYEILQHLSGYAGFRFQYVGYDKSWSQMQDMLEAGEIDVLTSAQMTPQRLQRFDFSLINIGFSTAILTVKAGDDSFIQNDYSNWNGIRVGMIWDNSRNEQFSDFARQWGFTYVPVYFDSTDRLVEELQKDR